MYKIGDMIVYEGSYSVCRVSDIASFDFPGAGGSRLYYVLKPLHQDCVIYNPVDNPSSFSRPVLTREEAERIIDALPGLEAAEAAPEARPSQEVKQAAGYYESIIRARDCTSLFKLIKSLYERKQLLARSDRHIGSIEAAAMRRAEQTLYDEFSVALEIPREDVQGYIEARVRAKRGGGA